MHFFFLNLQTFLTSTLFTYDVNKNANTSYAGETLQLFFFREYQEFFSPSSSNKSGVKCVKADGLAVNVCVLVETHLCGACF